jgi:hypothetical protein
MINLHSPNELQHVPLCLVRPSKENVRLFVERESLDKLRSRYREWRSGHDVLLPDAPILRVVRGQNKDLHAPELEILAGERRVTAAILEDLSGLDCRVVTMSDEEAYRFILDHNDVAGLTTAELAFRAAEMDRLGFSRKEISDALKGASPLRYIEVGTLINPEWFTDEPKLCDPTIVQWFEARQFGALHFESCFKNWNSGLWDAKQCAREFRRRGKDLPLDNAEKGLRVTFDSIRLVVRGQIDLSIMEDETAQRMLDVLAKMITEAKDRLTNEGDFGDREVAVINPTTLV